MNYTKLNIDKLCMFFFLLYMISYNIFSYRAETVIFSEIILIILLGCVAIYILMKNKIEIGTLGFLFAVYFLWSTCTIYWAINQQIAFSRLKTIAQLIIMSLMLFNYFDDEIKIHKAIKMITISYIVLGIYTVNFYGINNLLSGLGGTRIGSDISQENILGVSLALGSVLCFYHGLYKNKKLYYLGTMFLFIISAFTGSRKALIIVLFGVVSLTFMKNRTKKIWKTIILILIISIAGYYLFKLPMFELVLKRFEGFLQKGGKVEASAIVRSSMIKDGYFFFTQNPIIGYGLDCFRILGYGTYSHNNYIEILINGGSISFILYYCSYVYVGVKLSKKAYKFDNVSIVLLVTLIIQLIMDFAQVSYYSKVVYINFAIYFSYIKVTNKKSILYSKVEVNNKSDKKANYYIKSES